MRVFGFSSQTWHAAKQRGAITPRPTVLSIDELCAKGVPRGRDHLRIRLLAAGLLEEKCAECELTEWRGRPISVELHHRNGDRHDNRLENLEFLCPNCHAQTDTYAGRKRVTAPRGGGNSPR